MTDNKPVVPPYSLAHLTVLAQTPPEVISVAARAGYDFAGLRLLPAAPGGPAYNLMEDAAMLRETLARMEDTGVGVFDLEIVRINAGFQPDAYQAFLETGARLGGKAILVGVDDEDEQRRADNYARFCEAALPYGLRPNVEFMPWTAVKNLNDAYRMVQQAGEPENGGILIDALHFGRSATTLEDVRALPRQWMQYAQICDAPAIENPTLEDYIHAGRIERLLPGEGGIDVQGLWNSLPEGLPVSVELPTQSRAHLSPVEWAAMTLDAAKRVVAARR
ncbi:sugar phosphate isomerase/epimerase family protein [Kerstersia gyiorum]|uniref:sugar phosphate isomerase/epimerase family protein n=1 Tax=Kerstersia gyiorum TaxID=206506 RepID=UPI00242C8D59|nr:TIM barrel protein [Kerstersia gyiorum]MCH4270936.1 sugar phosphate isomerase/epimerase [Kerstersia gyiorum]MCI1229908.1 sugar phosphate isomerase/epimerase [Kerstersia gyiorum]